MTATRTKTVDLTNLSQGDAAWLVGRPTSWLKNRADLVLRSATGGYNARELVEAVSGMVPLVELSADDQERALSAMELIRQNGGDEWTSQAVCVFLDAVERRHGDGGLLAVLNLWRSEWRTFVEAMAPLVETKSEAEIRAEYAAKCEAAIEAARYVARHEYLLSEITKCQTCGLFRWGTEWTEANPHPELDVRDDICPACFRK